ncbi:Limb region 1 -like protein [Rhizophlyctis rosea]|nr:Limb region 1 -like protein [Rhizophlyctis rosea]
MPATVSLFCCCGLAGILGELILLPLTAGYLRFCPIALVERLWFYSVIGSFINLYALLPFGYFFLEAHDTTWYSKAKECIQTLWRIWLLGGSLVYVTIRMFGVQGFVERHPSLLVLTVLTSLPSVVICAIAAPKGVTTLFSLATKLLLPFNHHEVVTNKITELQYEAMALENKLQNGTPRKRASVTMRRQLTDIRSEEQRWQKEYKKSPIGRIVLAAVLVAINSSAWLITMIRILWSSIKTVFGETFLGFHELPPYLWLLSEVIAVLYFEIVTLVGIYHTLPSLLPNNIPRGGLSSRRIILNIMLLLVISISLPLLARMLGLTSLENVGPYSDFAFLGRHPIWTSAYKAVVLVLLGMAGRIT